MFERCILGGRQALDIILRTQICAHFKPWDCSNLCEVPFFRWWQVLARRWLTSRQSHDKTYNFTYYHLIFDYYFSSFVMKNSQKTGGRYDWGSWCQRRRADQLWRICKHDDFLIHCSYMSKDNFGKATVIFSRDVYMCMYILLFLHIFVVSTSLYKNTIISSVEV